jgi:tagatose 1,6-diphosphate aldolase
MDTDKMDNVKRAWTGLSTAERRGFQQICGADGKILVIALDQRNAMRDLLTEDVDERKRISNADLGLVKADIVKYLGNYAPAVLLDPECALPMLVDEGVLARDVALVVGMDASGWDVKPGSSLRYSRLVPGITARRIRELGGTAAKLMVFMRADLEGGDPFAQGLIRQCVEDCAAEELLLVVEILVYKTAEETPEEYEMKKPQLILQAAKSSKKNGAKVLKLQYPGSAEACTAVTTALGDTPWAILSAGADHETFLEELRTAIRHGATGAIAGRALWKDCLSMKSSERQEKLQMLGLPRLAEIQAVLRREEH